jgi:uncharacterized membrane protein YfcA
MWRRWWSNHLAEWRMLLAWGGCIFLGALSGALWEWAWPSERYIGQGPFVVVVTATSFLTYFVGKQRARYEISNALEARFFEKDELDTTGEFASLNRQEAQAAVWKDRR